ncbi:MAG: phenylalanine--tRNA ligase subunit beta [Candidatus Eremiobacteraeota bacterium]|nr:phenylalanine--tRNA ligase subunit beta [Candidatus Eremiobacteraeota bacterium]
MKLPIAWLRDYLDLELQTGDVAERLAALGFPVDGIERRPKLSGVVVGKLVRVEKHPDADRLQVCTVDVAGPRALTIATAATNVAVGQIVPVATIGAEVARLTIAPRKMRGIDSEGMLCSAEELGLEAAWFDDGILQLDSDLELGANVVDLFRLSDDVLDVEITANRVDAMSIVGLARELAASLDVPVREPAIALRDEALVASSDARVEIESADCKRFVAQRFSNVSVRPAPFWMRVRLALAGQRPINNLVDISNFVMLETAQPLHFYDFAQLAGSRLVVRDAREGEPIRTLDEADRALDARFLVIADDAEPQCIAGLKGAAASEITNATRELLVEAATFSGPRIRRMSVALGLRTEASTRHEKGLALGLSTLGAARAAYLLEREGATVRAPFAVGASAEAAAPIAVTPRRIEALLGVPVAAGEAERALRGLGFAVAARGDALQAAPPYWRADVRIPEDVVEEVARVVGYDRIVATMPPVFEQAVSSEAYRTQSRTAHALAALGYCEAIALSLQPAAVRESYERANVELPGAAIDIANPLNEDQRYLRFSLLPGLLELAARHGGGEPYRIFEIGDVFEGRPEPVETAGAMWLLALSKSDEPIWHDAGFLTFKGESLAFVRTLTGRDADASAARAPAWHPGKTAALSLDGRAIATIGAVDPRLLAVFGIEARVYAGRTSFAELPPYRVPRYVAPSRYPAVSRDLALVVAPNVPAKDIEGAARAAGDGMLADVRVFDEYRGPQVGDGKKSIALRVTLQRRDATLTDAQADSSIAAILAALRERCGATIRG